MTTPGETVRHMTTTSPYTGTILFDSPEEAEQIAGAILALAEVAIILAAFTAGFGCGRLDAHHHPRKEQP